MRVLFSAQRASFLKNFDSVIGGLAARGHDVTVALEDPEGTIAGQESLLEEIEAVDGVTIVAGPPPTGERGTFLAQTLRAALDWAAFQDPRYPPSYRRAWEKRSSGPARRASGSPAGRRAVAAAEASIAPSPALTRWLEEQAPDVVLLTPHIFPGSQQPEILRAAQALGIPAAVAVHSWDNLSSKGRIRLQPHRVFVWNELQRQEAAEFHGIPPELVAVTGAQAYDWWFETRPTPREEFLGRVGLDPGRPYVLYACSASWTGRVDVDFVLPWIDALRAAGIDAGVLIRPHPKRVESWPELDVSALDNVAIWPRSPELPGGRVTRQSYYDSVHHSSALVGVNTSAMIEAAILEKPVLTLSLPEFADEQEGTLHFRYLTGGLAESASSIEEHVGQLREALADPDPERARAFTSTFVRPYGLDRPATPRFVDEVERLAGARPTPARRNPAQRVAGPLVVGAYAVARAVRR